MKTKKLYAAIILLSFLVIGIQPVLASIQVPSQTHIGSTQIATYSGNTYTLIADVAEALFIEQNELILDGDGHTITGPGPGLTGVGVDINGKTGVTVKNLTITGFDHGIIINQSNLGPAEPKPNNLINNTIKNASEKGISLSSTNSTIISGNNIEDCFWGIYLLDSGNTDIWPNDPYQNFYDYNNHITGNTVTNISLPVSGGIWLASSKFNNVVGNNVSDHSFTGIWLTALNHNPNAPSTNNTLEGNNCSGSDNGIYLYNADDNSVTGNTTTNNNYGIKLKDSDNNTMTNNTVSNNTLYGIWLDPSNNNQINNNNFITNPTQAEVINSTGNNFDGNYWSDWDGSVPFVVVPGVVEDNSPFSEPDGWITNEPPVADAGPDQTVECACQTPAGTQITLDGSGSSDPDGDPLTSYIWTGPFEENPASGPNPTVTLNPGCLGDYIINLVVNDGQDDSEPDTVTVTLVDTIPPDITCPGDTTVEAMGPDGVPKDDDRIQAFLAGASATDNCDLEPTITNNAPDVFLPGDTIVTFTATDISGNPSTCQSTLTVVEAEESNLRIIPRIINRDGRLQKILAVIRFPTGTTEGDIDINQPLVLYPGDSPIGIEATNQRVVTWSRWGTLRVAVFACFPKDDVTAGVPENGQAEMMVIGRFMSGQYFYGFDNVWICSWNW